MTNVRSQIKVLHYVWWRNAHIDSLIKAQRAHGIDARQSQALIPTSMLRILFAPFCLAGYRILGYQIIHLHWVAGHFKPSTSTSKFMARFYFQWFKLFLWSSHVFGLQVVWTAHNLLPHDQIFPDDLLARKYLVSHSDVVFALNPTSKQNLEHRFNAVSVTEIPVAEVIPQPTESREETRTSLGIKPGEILFSHFGHIRPYKGTDKFLQAIGIANQPAQFLIAGTPGPNEYMETIHSLKDSALNSGMKLNYQEGFLLEAELANFIQASDFLVCPFEAINNSGFVNIAFAMGVPVILSDVEGLSWVPRDAAIWIHPANDAASLAQTIKRACHLTPDEVTQIVQSATRYSQDRNWDSYVLPQVSAYKALIQ